MSVKVRKAAPADIFALMQMMKMFLAEHASGLPEMNDLDCLKWLTSIVEIGGAFVAIKERKLIGSIGCGVDAYPWNRNEKFIYDEWFYVRPEFRKGTNAAKLLLDEIKKTADQNKLRFVFSVNSGIDKRLDRYLSIQGFRYAGGIHIYGLMGAQDG